MDQSQAPIVEALAKAAGRTIHGFGAPGHHGGAAIPDGLRPLPGQRISVEHAAWLAANREAGMFVLDPTDPSERCVRVVA